MNLKQQFLSKAGDLSATLNRQYQIKIEVCNNKIRLTLCGSVGELASGLRSVFSGQHEGQCPNEVVAGATYSANEWSIIWHEYRLAFWLELRFPKRLILSRFNSDSFEQNLQNVCNETVQSIIVLQRDDGSVLNMPNLRVAELPNHTYATLFPETSINGKQAVECVANFLGEVDDLRRRCCPSQAEFHDVVTFSNVPSGGREILRRDGVFQLGQNRSILMPELGYRAPSSRASASNSVSSSELAASAVGLIGGSGSGLGSSATVFNF